MKFKKPLQPVQQKGRRIPIALQDKVATEIQRLTSEGRIRKLKNCNEDQFISPILITVKKDGSLKIALDSKKLNEWVIKNKYQMPSKDELVDQIAQIITSKKHGRVWFTTVDSAYAYGQLRLALETARQCNASVVGGAATGTYQFQTGLYGLADMPVEFQQAMDRTVGTQPGVFAFLDDVLIVSKGAREEHQTLVMKTLKQMDQQDMSIKLEEGTFESDEIEWLGYKITQEGICPLKGKIESIRDQQSPKNLKQLRSLMGAAHQLNRYIKGLAQFCDPFRTILSKEKNYERTEEHEKAFKTLKSEVKKITQVAHFDSLANSSITCDASREGLGAVFEQFLGGERKPIAFASRFLNASEQR